MEQWLMKIRSKWVLAGTALTLAAGLGTYAFTASSQEAEHGFGPQSMHGMGPGMMGRGMMGPGAGMSHDAGTMTDMRVIHALLANHNRIRRTVTNLPDGIRTVTESDDPRVVQLIKDHVADMGRRMRAGRPMGLPIESSALRAMYRNKDKIKTTVETTEKGVIVVQTSNDRSVVEILQTHASEVSDLVNGGMQALHMAMMRNGRSMHGPMMGGRMHGGMMSDGR
jgi:hypothetical protein